MASPGAIFSSRLGRASKVAELRASVARQSLDTVRDLERQAEVMGSLAQGANRAEDEGRHRWSRLRQNLMPDDRRALVRAHQSAADELAEELADGIVSEDYIDYLRRSGVHEDTIARVIAGDLPMDARSRELRAAAMGLDPDVVWNRVDYPSKTEFGGGRRGGLVYANRRPELSRSAAQVVDKHNYPLLGPGDGIHGLDSMPPLVGDSAEARRQLAHSVGMTGSEFSAANGEIRRPLGATRADSVAAMDRRLATATEDDLLAAREGRHRPYPQGAAPPRWDLVETPAVRQSLTKNGAKGTLVRDEADTSVAFTPAATLRHALLAAFDPQHAASRNIFQGIAVPVTAAAASGGLSGDRRKPGVLSGLTEDR